jgi:hypothetical protein
MLISDDLPIPVNNNLVVNLNESFDLVIELIENLPNYFKEPIKTLETCFVLALKTAKELIGEKNHGKMIFFQVSNQIIRCPEISAPSIKHYSSI